MQMGWDNAKIEKGFYDSPWFVPTVFKNCKYSEIVLTRIYYSHVPMVATFLSF